MPSEVAIRAARDIMQLFILTPLSVYRGGMEPPAIEERLAEIIDREFSRGPLVVTPHDPAKTRAAELLEKLINHTVNPRTITGKPGDVTGL